MRSGICGIFSIWLAINPNIVCAENIQVNKTNNCERRNNQKEVYSCIKSHFADLYMNHYDWLWIKLRQMELEFTRCMEPNFTTEFFDLYISLKPNAEAGEWYSELIEIQYINNPYCILEGLHASKRDTQTEIIGLLKNPVLGKRKRIISASQKIGKSEKYKSLLEEINR